MENPAYSESHFCFCFKTSYLCIQYIQYQSFPLLSLVVCHHDVGELLGDVDGHGVRPEEEGYVGVLCDVAQELAERSV